LIFDLLWLRCDGDDRRLVDHFEFQARQRLDTKCFTQRLRRRVAVEPIALVAALEGCSTRRRAAGSRFRRPLLSPAMRCAS
jgi:hypothetical protein